MQRAHGRHKANCLACAAPLPNLPAKLALRSHDYGGFVWGIAHMGDLGSYSERGNPKRPRAAAPLIGRIASYKGWLTPYFP